MWKLNRKKLGLLVENGKRERDLTYEGMSKECDVSAAVLCRLANMEATPDLETLTKIADYLKTDPIELFIGGEDYINLNTLPAAKRKKIQEILGAEHGNLSIVSETD